MAFGKIHILLKMSDYGSSCSNATLPSEQDLGDLEEKEDDLKCRKRKSQEECIENKKIKLDSDKKYFKGCIIWDCSNDKLWLKL